MNRKRFQAWLAQVDKLGTAERREAEAVLSGGSQAPVSMQGLRKDVQCSDRHAVGGSSPQGKLAGIRNLSRGGGTVRASAGRCRLAVTTDFRRRHRCLAAESRDPRRLAGIVEADETNLLESRRGERHLDRKARRRGGKASKRGLSSEQVPVLVAADRSGMTVAAVLPAVNADALRDVIEPVVDDDIVLGGDGHRACPPCAAATGVRREALNLSGRRTGSQRLSHPD